MHSTPHTATVPAAFDVGDLLEVEGFPYRVKKIDLLYVVLVRATGERVYMPTSRLTALPVINLTRTKLKSDKLVISLDMGSSGAAAREKLQVCGPQHSSTLTLHQSIAVAVSDCHQWSFTCC